MNTNKTRGLWAVVPVKQFADTKRRLMPLLTGHERAELARVMLEDVLSVLRRTCALAGIMVITGDQDAAALAQAAGATVMADLENAGMTPALTKAARQLADEQRDGMLVLPADVPLITVADIETLVRAHRAAPSATLVPASCDGGTNALCCSPPGVMRFCFGEDSFRKHVEAARSAGIAAQIMRIERLGQDIDRPDDVASLLKYPSATRSYAYLTSIAIAERLRYAQRTAYKESSAQ